MPQPKECPSDRLILYDRARKCAARSNGGKPRGLNAALLYAEESEARAEPQFKEPELENLPPRQNFLPSLSLKQMVDSGRFEP